MPTEVTDSGIVATTSKDFPVLAVNVLERLGYHVSRASKQLDQILANERVEEQVGRDWWRHEYKVVMRWRKTVDGDAVLVSLELSEHKGGGSETDCKKRCDRIFLELQRDATRALEAKRDKDVNTSFGAARWGTEQELLDAGYLMQEPDPRRLIIGKARAGEYLQVPEMLSYAHAIVCGRTGVGKSRGFFIPQLVERIGTSMIVTEATPGPEDGELYRLTSGWRRLAGHEVYCFNPSDMSSHRINPIDRIRRAPDELKAATAEKLADLVIMNGESSEVKVDQTWNRSEKLLLVALILHAATCGTRGHFGALRWLLMKGPNELASVLYDSPSHVARLEFEGWMRLSGETNFKYGVFSGLQTKLNPWMTDQMVALTETTDIDFDVLKNKLFTFYLAVPSRSNNSKLIGSLMVNFLLDHILEIREQMKYPVAMLLDEFTNFGKIAGIADTLSIIRKNKIGLVLGFQNYFQLEQVYSRKEAQIILDMPATQIYFKQKSVKEAKELSDALGRMTLEETVVTDSGRVQEFVQGRALATPEELINLKNEVIVFTPDTWPLKLALTSPIAYEQPLSYPPPEREKHKVSEFIKTRGSAGIAKEDRADKEISEDPPAINSPNNLMEAECHVFDRAFDYELEEPEELKRKFDKQEREQDEAPDVGDVWQV
ncbi:MAG: type IV secretory system conjugative DNA transfer family protein [Candidatus Obscuribacterales bacterium]|nr:type IV secretory system conjugative DNA transfer family protein [Candidatus Obscuribacterales bacterium]MBY0552839.1 type IV secretory system conjugative DNA transfer family protein [Candidatus Obscuribacterales bacterium]